MWVLPNVGADHDPSHVTGTYVLAATAMPARTYQELGPGITAIPPLMPIAGGIVCDAADIDVSVGGACAGWIGAADGLSVSIVDEVTGSFVSYVVCIEPNPDNFCRPGDKQGSWNTDQFLLVRDCDEPQISFSENPGPAGYLSVFLLPFELASDGATPCPVPTVGTYDITVTTAVVTSPAKVH